MFRKESKNMEQIKQFLVILGIFTILGYPAGLRAEGASSGLPGQIFVNSDLSNFINTNAASINPALTTQVDENELTYGFSNFYFFSNVHYLSFIYPVGLKNSVGFVIYNTGTEIQESGTNFFGDPFLSNNSSYSEFEYYLNLSRRILPYLSAGINIKVINKNLFKLISPIGVGMDVGFILNPFDTYYLGKPNLGVTVMNVLAPQPDASDQNKSKEIYPLNIRLNLSHSFFRDALVISPGIIFEDVLPEANAFTVKPEKETNFSYHKLSLDAQLNLWHFLYVKAGFFEGEKTISSGFGLYFDQINVVNDFRFDYTLAYKVESGVLNKVHLTTHFGKNRAQKLMLSKFKSLNNLPSDLFNEAMRLYRLKKYWEAAFVFGKLLVFFPTYYQADVATFYLAKCFENLDMLTIARLSYENAFRTYSTSDLKPNFVFGSQNINYKTKNYDASLRNYSFIANLYSDADIKADADYIAGQIYYERKNYIKAIQKFQTVDQFSPVYPYAQFTLAIINLKYKKVREAIQHFMNVIKSNPQKASELVLVNRSYLMLGHLFQEISQLSKALEYYKKVDPQSDFYDEAIIGQAWAYSKLLKHRQSMDLAKSILSEHKNSRFLGEAYLILGYGFLIEKEYDYAQKILKKAEEISNQQLVEQEDSVRAVATYQDATKELNEIQYDILKLCYLKPDEENGKKKIKIFDQYRRIQSQMNFCNKIMSLIELNYKFKVSKPRLVSDIGYAVATGIRLKGQSEREDAKATLQAEQRKIDQEILELQKTLENLEQQDQLERMKEINQKQNPEK